MSQHFFETTLKDQSVRVQLGWDRPLQHYYLVVEVTGPAASTDQTEDEQENADSHAPEYLYSNLLDANAFGHDLQYYRAKLTELGITVPEQMFEQVERDQEMNVGNRQVLYSANGDFTSS